MNLTEIRKYIVLMLMVGILWLLLIFDFNLKETFIFPVANQLIKHNLIIVIILGIAGIVGLTYKNKKSYYSAYVNAELIIGYIVFFSMCATGFCRLSGMLTYAPLILFTLTYALLFFIKDQLKYETFKSRSNILNPIDDCDLLYDNRKSQASKLVRFIKNSESTKDGYSICINGEWGTGKTSFVNGVLDELTNKDKEEKGGKKGYKRIKVKEIRLNAMELDDLESLVKYFFERMKNILHTEGVYVGINSEYQTLMSSLIGAVIDEKISNFILSRFSTNSDYRENLEKLNQLIKRELKNIKIVIVVDDIERCDKAKIKDFLFFIKEIAMLSHCITIFVVDYNKLSKTHGISNDFMEKFFNERINLLPVDDKEIIRKSIGDRLFLKYLNETKLIFSQKIYDINNHLHIVNAKQKEEERQKDLQCAQKRQDAFYQLICNPRRLIKSYYKYSELLNTAEQYVNVEGYYSYLNKINYKKQIFLLSLIYGLFPCEYECFEINGIYMQNYSIFKTAEDNSNDENSNNKEIINIITNKEWDPFIHNYIANEKMRFCSYLLIEPDKLPLIANGFSSLSEEYVNSIEKNIKPNYVNFTGIMSEFISAKFNSVEEKERVIRKTILLYKDEINFDDLLAIIVNPNQLNDVTRDSATLKAFIKTSKQLSVVNKKKCKEQFKLFAQRYLVFKLTSINRLVLCAYMPNNNDSYNNITEAVYNKSDCSKMISAYCERICEVFNIKTENSTVQRLEDLYEYILTFFKNNNVINCKDVRDYANNAKSAIDDINCLFDIEKHISDYKGERPYEFDFSTSNYSEILAELLAQINKCDKYKSYDLQEQITTLFYNMLNCNKIFSANDLNKMDLIIQNFHDLVGDTPAPWRNIYIQLKLKNINSEQTENNKNVTK